MALSLLPIRDTSLTGLRVMRGKRQVGTLLRRSIGWEWAIIREGYGPIKTGHAVAKRTAIARLTQALTRCTKETV
jgi:hypothetical protein